MKCGARSRLVASARLSCVLVGLAPGALRCEELPWSLQLAFAEPPPADAGATPGPDDLAPAAPVEKAAPENHGEKSPVEGWRLEIAPFLIAAGMHGDIRVGPLTADVSVDFAELMEHFDMGAMAHVEAGYDRFGLLVDTIYMNLEDEFQRGPVEIDWRLTELMVGFAGSYRLGPFDLLPRREGEAQSVWRLRLVPDLYAGGRYVYIKARINPALLNGESKSADWLDPIVGARLALDITRRVGVVLRGDIGGFGAASELTWSAYGALRFAVAKHFAIEGGYTVIDYDYDEGGFSYNVQSRGPVLGFSFDF